MPPFVLNLITALLTLLWPAAPAWLARVIADLIPAVGAIVAALEGREDLTGPERAEVAIVEVGAFLDVALDDVPEWSAISEARRDRIIAGLVELALFAERVAARPGGRADIRGAVRRIRAGVKVGAARSAPPVVPAP